MKSEILAQLDLRIEEHSAEASRLEQLYARMDTVAKENNIVAGLRIAREIVAES